MRKILLFLLFSISLSVFGQEEYYEHVIGEDDDFSAFNAITSTPDGGYALVGFQNNGPNLTEVYLVKTDAQGNEEWSQNYGSFNIRERGYGLFVTSDEQLLLVGSSNFSFEPSELFFKKVDISSGTELWNKTFPLSPSNVNLSYDKSLINIIAPEEEYNQLHQFNFEGEKINEFSITEGWSFDFKEAPNGNYITSRRTPDENWVYQTQILEYDSNGNLISSNTLELPWSEPYSEQTRLAGFDFDGQGNIIVSIGSTYSAPILMASYNSSYQLNWYAGSPDSNYYDITSMKLKYDGNSQKIIAISGYETGENSFCCLQVHEDGTFQSFNNYQLETYGRISDFIVQEDGSIAASGRSNEGDYRNNKGLLVKINEDGIENFRQNYGVDAAIKDYNGNGIHYLGNDEFLVLSTDWTNGQQQSKIRKIDRAGYTMQENSVAFRYPNGMEPSNDGHFLTTYFNQISKLTKFTESGEILWERDLYNFPLFQKPSQFLVTESDGYSYAFSSNEGNTSQIHFIKLSEEGNVTDSTVVEVDLQIDRIDGMYKKSNNHYALYGINDLGILFLEFDENKNLIQNGLHSSDDPQTYFRRRQFIEGPNGTNNILGVKNYVISINGFNESYSSFFMIQFDENGNFIQEIEDTTSKGSASFYEAILLKDDSGFLAMGVSYNGPFIGDGETYLSKINWDGEIEWTQLISHTLGYNSILYDITEADDYFAFIGDVNKNNTGKIYYVHTDESIIGINNLPFQNATIQLFPNPTQDKINIAFENEQVVNGHITINNTMGQIIKTIKAPIFPNATLEIPVQDLADGVYILNIENGQEVIAKQFVVQH